MKLHNVVARMLPGYSGLPECYIAIAIMLLRGSQSTAMPVL